MSSQQKIDRVALVTGASRGIGAAVALQAAEAGFNLVISARGSKDLSRVEKACIDLGVEVLVVEGDITDRSFVNDLFRKINQKFRRLDVLVNNAGALADGAIGLFTSEKISNAIELNLVSAIECTQLASRLMVRSGGGAIVNVSSIMATNGAPGQTVYASAKAGLLGLTRSAAKELGAKGITVNAVAPGLIDTSLLSVLSADELGQRILNIPVGRLGTAREVADLVVFLISDRARYINGQVIGIDGGLVI